MSYRLEVQPERGPVDGPLAIRLTGFSPGCTLTVRARTEDARGRAWASHAVYRADARGAVDVAASEPVSGCYAGADSEGLLWSLEPVGPAPRAPFDESSLGPLSLTFSVDLEGSAVATATIERYVLARDCRAVPVNEDGLVGTLFLPAGAESLPTVLVLGGSTGGQVFSAQCAALLAGHGYASLALSYFSDEGLPEHLLGIRLEYFGRALSWLRAQPWARAEGVAVVGRSRGGELALLLGATFPEVRAVVAYSPSNVVWGGLRNGRGVDAPAWVHQDRPVPYLAPSLTPAQEAEVFRKRPFALRPIFDMPLDPQAVSAATIPVERTRGSVLLFSGDGDEMWSAGRMGDAVIGRLREHRHPHPFAHHRYAGAGHLLRAPCMPTSVIDSPMYALGGSPRGQALANRHSWTELLRALGGQAQ